MSAKYYYFKPGSGKWKYEGEGKSLPNYVEKLDHDYIYKLNGGMPGINSDGKDFIVVIIDEESFPRLIFAKRFD